ncbi:MAG TPA: trypsin-like peptidase domain-containing protein, partial [Candidatus Thermoplasmatota archaeon]|nr:trypsin-like peptidase domain-containing protein [Candidatus Thermoplasmatota archaeon]
PILLAAVLAATALAGCSEGALEPVTVRQRPGPIVYDGPWPDLETRPPIRPGAQVVAMGSQCTANFLFRSPDNATLYLGIAAHCFGSADEPFEVGTPVTVGGIANAGTVAYMGWAFDPSGGNDFGLIELSSTPIVRSRVHPAMLGWGGPVGLADQAQMTPGTQVVAYGHSSQRANTDPENVREGHIYRVNADGSADVMSDYPGIQGDSGSGLMTAAGQAIGVLSTKLADPSGGALGEERDQVTLNNYVSLKAGLERMGQAVPELAGLELVTWKLLDRPDGPLSPPGPLPDLPVLG